MGPRRSIRRSLLIYAVVACSSVALGVTTLATVVLMDATRRARAEVSPTPDLEPRPQAHVTTSRAIRQVLVGSLGIGVGAGLVLAWLSSRLVLRPLRGLTERLGAAGEAPWADDEEGGHDELGALARALRHSTRREREARELQLRRDVELAQLQAQLARSDKLASIGQLAAGLAHEVGNPLSATIGYLHLLERGLPAEQASEVVGRSLGQLDRINQSIKDLLGFARQDEPAPLSEVVLGTVVADVLALARVHPAVREVTLTVTEGAELSLSATADPHKLTQIVLNLLINGAHAAAASTTKPEVRLDLHADGPDRVELSVEDSGAGVPEALRDRIFDPFFTSRPAGEGTGLGLAVSRALAREMGGDLRVARGRGLPGARFTLRLRATIFVT